MSIHSFRVGLLRFVPSMTTLFLFAIPSRQTFLQFARVRSSSWFTTTYDEKYEVAKWLFPDAGDPASTTIS